MATALKPRLQKETLWFLVLLCIAATGCARFDYSPRGLHLAVNKSNDKAKYIPKSGMYMVKKGDTLYRIGRRFGVDFKALARKNNIAKPYTIYLGQRIYLKGIAPVAKSISVLKKQSRTTKKRDKVSRTNKRKVLPVKPKHPVATRSHVSLRWPVKGKVSSKFGPRGSRMHDGIDIAANEGVAVTAAAAGEVVYADSRLTGYGNLVIVRHSTDLFTAYAHNKVNLVKRGDKVKAGQRIAYVGSTGRSSGPHLHFEVRRGETAVDPLAYLPK